MADAGARDYQAIAYELPEIWRDGWFGADDRERIHRVAQLIPGEAQSLLDVGCGNGLFLRALAADPARTFHRLAGVDRSAAALAHLPTEKHRAPIDALPFRDQEFDAVTCLEVLEHLPVDVYPRALAELCRVARQYLLVSVPYRQDLEASLTECPSCRARFNPDFHVRSFDDESLRSLFLDQGFRPITLVHLGESVIYLDQVIRQRLKAAWTPPAGLPSYAVCPVCGFHDSEKLRSDLARRTTEVVALMPPPSLARRWLSRIIPAQRHYRWACALYQRSH